MSKKIQGFTLIELMIVIAIIAIIAAIAVPNLLSARLGANESNAISTLRNLVSGQAQFQQTAAVDEDQDGTGEYGTFSEMSGIMPLNTRGGNPNAPATPLAPPVLAASFRTAFANANGEVSKSGYIFRIYLPDAAGLGVGEANGAFAAVPDSDLCENVWCAYAWPANLGSSGNRAFFTNQQGEIIQTTMNAVTYTGPGAGPTPGAALDANNGGANVITGSLGIGQNVVANDGNLWTPAQ